MIFKEVGFTAIKSKVVDAPYIQELPVNLECDIIQIHEIGSHNQFIAQIMNVKIDDNLLNKDKPIIELLKPIVYGVGNDFNYYRIGENINIGWFNRQVAKPAEPVNGKMNGLSPAVELIPVK